MLDRSVHSVVYDTEGKTLDPQVGGRYRRLFVYPKLCRYQIVSGWSDCRDGCGRALPAWSGNTHKSMAAAVLMPMGGVMSQACGMPRPQGDARLRSTFNDCTKVLLEEQASRAGGRHVCCWELLEAGLLSTARRSLHPAFAQPSPSWPVLAARRILPSPIHEPLA